MNHSTAAYRAATSSTVDTRASVPLFVLLSAAASLTGCLQQPDPATPDGPYLGQTPPGTIPEVFAPGIISQAGFDLHSSLTFFRFSLSGDGTVYLSSDRTNSVNTPVTEQIAYVAPDESHFVFYRYDRLDLDETGLYISFCGEGGSWSEGRNMGEAFNAPAEAVTQAASLSPDGRYFFFLRRRHEAICWVDARVIERQRPKPGLPRLVIVLRILHARLTSIR